LENSPERPRYPRNKSLHTRRRLALFGLGLGSYLLGILLSRFPSFTETVYGSGIGPLASRILTSLTGWLPFSLGEVLALAYLVYQILSMSIALRAAARRERQLGNAIGSGALRIARDVGVLATLFYLLWGFNYSRAPLENRIGWQLPDSIPVEELTELSRQMVNAANEAYRQVHGSDDAGTPTTLPGGRNPTVAALATGWMAARRSLGFPARLEPSGKVKAPLSRPFQEWAGVSGFYFPFTAEPHVRGGIPAVNAPKILAHEMAHQRGVAQEGEANFWGFLAAASASDPLARYSAYVFAQQQLLSLLARADGETVSSLVGLRIPGVQRDIQAAAEYWRQFRGPGTRLGRVANHAYLRTNRVHGGVLNYSRSVLLMVAYARNREGRLVPVHPADRVGS
jgi:hypothetical protein